MYISTVDVPNLAPRCTFDQAKVSSVNEEAVVDDAVVADF